MPFKSEVVGEILDQILWIGNVYSLRFRVVHLKVAKLPKALKFFGDE